MDRALQVEASADYRESREPFHEKVDAEFEHTAAVRMSLMVGRQRLHLGEIAKTMHGQPSLLPLLGPKD